MSKQMTNKTPLLQLLRGVQLGGNFDILALAPANNGIEQLNSVGLNQAIDAAIIKAMELMRNACKKAIIKDDGCGLHFVLKGCDELEPMQVLKEAGFNE